MKPIVGRHFRVVQGFTHTPTSSPKLGRVLNPQIDRGHARKQSEIDITQTNYACYGVLSRGTGTPDSPPIYSFTRSPNIAVGPHPKLEWQWTLKLSVLRVDCDRR
jgi:hypothetical protein